MPPIRTGGISSVVGQTFIWLLQCDVDLTLECAYIKRAQCGKIANFLLLRFFVKSFFDGFRVSKTAILTILEATNVDFGKF